MEEVLSSVAGPRADNLGSSDDLDPEEEEEGENETKGARKKKNKRRKGTFSIIFCIKWIVNCMSHQPFLCYMFGLSF